MYFNDINMEKSYSPFLSYARSKLSNILFTKELANRLEGMYKYNSISLGFNLLEVYKFIDQVKIFSENTYAITFNEYHLLNNHQIKK